MEKREILELAKTAFISLTEEQAEKFLTELEEIVGSIEEALDSVNLKDVKEGEYSKKFIDLFAEDSPENHFDRESMMMNAKRQKDGFILVPKLIKEEK